MSRKMGTLNKPEPSVSVSQPTSSPFKTEISDLFQARCIFFTDGLKLEEAQTSKLLKELSIFKDIKFSPTDIDAMIFGERFLYQILWAKAKFTFQFLLRVDDDYFICMERLLYELPFRPKNNLSWGVYHCHDEDLVYMDESWALFSQDVIQQFLSQDPQTMLCHPFGDQTFTLWINASTLNLNDFNDHRLHYWPPAGKLEKFYSIKNVCDKFLGIHGSYPDVMRYLWLNNNDSPKDITDLTLLRESCFFQKVFDVNKFKGVYSHKPRRCLEKPRWVSMLKSWAGSESLDLTR